MKKQIIKHLTNITACGMRQSEVFNDFVDIVDATLTMLPAHYISASTKGAWAEDTKEIQELWGRLRNNYKAQYFNEFSAAQSLLMEATEKCKKEKDYQDLLGEIFMEFSNPNGHNGQFFTPMHLCRAMAVMTCEDIPKQVMERIKAAVETDALAESMFAAIALMIQYQEKSELTGDQIKWLSAAIGSVKDKIQPIRVMDPACGSGSMLLAVACSIPTWMSECGFVQYFGQDIDRTCCLMGRINMRLYGLNGYSSKFNYDAGLPDTKMILDPVEVEIQPEPKPEKRGQLEFF